MASAVLMGQARPRVDVSVKVNTGRVGRVFATSVLGSAARVSVCSPCTRLLCLHARVLGVPPAVT